MLSITRAPKLHWKLISEVLKRFYHLFMLFTLKCNKDEWIIHDHNPLLQFHLNKKLYLHPWGRTSDIFPPSFYGKEAILGVLECHCIMHLIKNVSSAKPGEDRNEGRRFYKSLAPKRSFPERILKRKKKSYRKGQRSKFCRVVLCKCRVSAIWSVKVTTGYRSLVKPGSFLTAACAPVRWGGGGGCECASL